MRYKRHEEKSENHTMALETLRIILKTLDNQQKEYVIIHGSSNLNGCATSDIDIAFDQNPKEVLNSVLKPLIDRGKLSIIQCLHYEIPYGYYYILKIGSTTPPVFLHLDCLYDPIGINRYHIPTTFLLENKIKTEISHASHDKEAIYYALKKAVKGNLSEEDFAKLKNLLENPSSELSTFVQDWFGLQGSKIITELLKTASPVERGHLINQLHTRVERRFLRCHPIRVFLHFIFDLMRKIRRFVTPTGLFVVVLGPDGSGKSTLVNALLNDLQRAFRRTWRFHWRPGLLPKLGGGSSTCLQTDNSKSTAASPPKKAKYGKAVSLLRYGYYLLDFILGYWAVVYPRRAQTTLILGERWYYDVIASPERYGFNLPQWLLRFGKLLIPLPDLTILLVADPENIHARKPELSPDEIKEQLDRLTCLMPPRPRGKIIHTDVSVTESVKALNEAVLAATARKTTNRLFKSEWRIFPRFGRTKLLMHRDDQERNAFHLYHPYSKAGQAFKYFASLLPSCLDFLAFRKRMFFEEGTEQFEKYTNIICNTLGNQTLFVNFSLGTPGPHQKVTAQVCDNGKIIAYVKIGTREEVVSLLKREGDMLDALAKNPSPTYVVPRVLASLRQDGEYFLFLSAPDKPGRQRSIDIGESDILFLLGAIPEPAVIKSYDDFRTEYDLKTVDQDVTICNSRIDKIIHAAHSQIKKAFATKGILVGISHGDYAPWNTMELTDGSLYIFDWEYSVWTAPLLFDLFHCLLMPAKLVKKYSPHKIIDNLMGLEDNQLFGRIVRNGGLSASEIPYYILLYLLILFERKKDDKIFTSFLGECMQEVLNRMV
ncbi:MAG: thymidylate kinase-like protein [uncultured bacterium]|nr:MAG: thymidylate kinase-like protein [uncultured bacterium]